MDQKMEVQYNKYQNICKKISLASYKISSNKKRKITGS